MQKASAALLALATLAVAAPKPEPVVKPIEFDYYAVGVSNCNSTAVSAITIDTAGKCYKLNNTAISFRIGAAKAPVPEKCKIRGYATSDCNGEDGLRIEGKDPVKPCYNVEKVGKTVNSVVLDC